MNCDKCQSQRVACINAKCGDLFNVELGINELQDYVPKDLGIGGGDYIKN